jgi:dephospho-CoA kinase
VVWAPVEAQFKRAVARGLRGDDVRARIKAQMPLEEKRKLATVVIDNSGTKAKTRRQVEAFWKELRPPT